MADLPRARVLQATQGAGVGNGSELLAIFAPVADGKPVNEPRLYTQVQECLDTFDFNQGLDAGAHHVELNRLPFLFVGLEEAVAASIGPVNCNGVTGSSTLSFSGTPKDDAEIVVEVLTGGIVGTAGIVIRCSIDGGTSWKRNVRLGTSTSYVIPNTGITVNATAGSLVEGDTASARCVASQYDATGLNAARDALAATGHLPRIILVCGDADDANDVQTLIDEIEAYETENQRHSRIFANARQRYADCEMQKPRGTYKRSAGTVGTLTFDAALDTLTRSTGSWIDDGFAVGQAVTIAGAVASAGANNGAKGVISALTATVMTLPAAPGLTAEAALAGDGVTITGVSPGDIDFTATTITRNIGSFVTDGFKVGMYVTVDGSVSNDGEIGPLTVVTATVLTFAAGGAIEANVAGTSLTITGTEKRDTWRSAMNTIVGATPETEKESHRLAFRAGRLRRKSPIDQSRKMRPFAWAEAFRIMGHDLHVSPAKVALGSLEGWTMHDVNGAIEHAAHDERVHGGLLDMRIGCSTTIDDQAGVFVALPLTLDADNAIYSRLPNGLVADLACRIAKLETTMRLSSDVVTNIDGTIKESEAKTIEESVNTALEAKLLTEGPEGQRASAVEFTMARDVNLLEPGAEIDCEVLITHLGYLEKISTTVRARVGG